MWKEAYFKGTAAGDGGAGTDGDVGGSAIAVTPGTASGAFSLRAFPDAVAASPLRV